MIHISDSLLETVLWVCIFGKIYIAADTILWKTLQISEVAKSYFQNWIFCGYLVFQLGCSGAIGGGMTTPRLIGRVLCCWLGWEWPGCGWVEGISMFVRSAGGGKGGWVGMFSGVSWEWATGGEHLVALTGGDWPCKIGGAPGSSIGFALIFGKFMTQCKNWGGDVF